MTPIKAFAATIFALMLSMACDKDSSALLTEESEAGTEFLSYSGVFIVGSTNVPWTNQSGALVFAVVRNQSNSPWRGHPEAAAYTINEDGSRGELLSTGKGVLTSFVDRENFVPTDEVRSIPADDEVESLTFVPVDFSETPRVYVYWRFADKDNGTLRFKQIIHNPRAQKIIGLAQASALLQE